MLCASRDGGCPKLSVEPERIQQCFYGLDVKADVDDFQSIDSFSSLGSGSIGSISSNILGSISGVLSSAMSTALTFRVETEMPQKQFQFDGHGEPIDRISTLRIRPYSDDRHKPNHVLLQALDFEWLHERCDGDIDLLSEVLKSFCEQGQIHLSAMQQSFKEINIKTLEFHAVIIVEFSLMVAELTSVLSRRIFWRVRLRMLEQKFWNRGPKRFAVHVWPAAPISTPRQFLGSKS
jgi:hypothetical protein